MPAQHYSLEETVFAALEEKILNGTLKAGEVITEQMLCETTGASRTPVREAIHRLEQDGLVTAAPNRSAVVVGITTDDLADIYEIRRGIEGLASRYAARRAGAEQKDKLREIVELQEFFLSRNGTERMKELDSAFHELVYSACGSRIITSMLSRLHRQIGLYRKISLNASGRTAASVAEHRRIYEAIAAGDGEAAESLTIQHVQNAYLNLMQVLEEV